MSLHKLVLNLDGLQGLLGCIEVSIRDDELFAIRLQSCSMVSGEMECVDLTVEDMPIRLAQRLRYFLNKVLPDDQK